MSNINGISNTVDINDAPELVVEKSCSTDSLKLLSKDTTPTPTPTPIWRPLPISNAYANATATATATAIKSAATAINSTDTSVSSPLLTPSNSFGSTTTNATIKSGNQISPRPTKQIRRLGGKTAVQMQGQGQGQGQGQVQVQVQVQGQPITSLLVSQNSVGSSIISSDDADPLDRSGHVNANVNANANANVNANANPRTRLGSNEKKKTIKDPPAAMFTSTSTSTSTPMAPFLFDTAAAAKIPKMKEPSQCNVFCAFYAEFDNIVGPKVSFQAPRYFMDNDIAIGTEEIEMLLSKSFRSSSPSVSVSVSVSATGENATANANVKNKDDETNIKGGEDKEQNPQKDGEKNDAQPKPPTVPQNSQSIFDSTCEYIITGNELTGQIINVSTHNVHVITSPTVIQDARYERNSLLFSVGFVLRRKSDPSPFRPLLSRLASTLRAMEIESRFLSSAATKPRIQHFLDAIVPSLNSSAAKCHLLLDDANALHMQYFPPPKMHAPPVPHYAVPVLLRPEYQLQSLDWDLTINWIVPYINGIKHAKLIAESSKVDQEMVLSCLRVLRHHNALALVDVFRYSNIYESTLKAQHMLAGEMDGLLQEAFHFVSKHSMAPSVASSRGGRSNSLGSLGNVTASFKSSKSVRVGNAAGVSTAAGNGGKMTLLAPIINGPSSYPPVQSASFHSNTLRPDTPLASSYSSSYTPSYTPGPGIYMVNIPPTSESPSSSKSSSTGRRSAHVPPPSSLASGTVSMAIQVDHLPSHFKKEQKAMTTALAILYASCQRGMTVGEVLMHRIAKTKTREKEDTPGAFASGQQNKTAKKKKKKKKASYRSSSVGSGDIDWMEVFNYLDHRRFVTFGVIHGLIRRVHEYPIVCNAKDEEDNEDEKQKDASIDDVKPSLVRRNSPSLERTSRLSSHGEMMLQPQRPAHTINGFSLESASSTDSVVRHQVDSSHQSVNSFSSTVTQKTSQSMRSLSNKIAASMDGTRCDDELSCTYQKSMKELKDLVKKYGKQEVISIYSTSQA